MAPVPVSVNMEWVNAYLIDTRQQIQTFMNRYPYIQSEDFETSGNQTVDVFYLDSVPKTGLGQENWYHVINYDALVRAYFALNHLPEDGSKLAISLDNIIGLIKEQRSVLAGEEKSISAVIASDAKELGISPEYQQSATASVLAIIRQNESSLLDTLARLQLVSNRLHGLPDYYQPKTK